MTSAPAVGPSAVEPPPELLRSFEWTDRIAASFLGLINERLALTPRSAQPRYTMRHPETGGTTGEVTVHDGQGLQAMVLSTASTPALRMWQAVAFTPPSSPVPHLSFDAKANPGGCWFSIDLVPRAACSDAPAWTEYVYEPLSELVWDLQERPDMRPSQLRPQHRAHLSPWLISMRLLDDTAVPAAVDAVSRVTERFLDILNDGVPQTAAPPLDASGLAGRDAREREYLYSWKATANYRYLAMIAGDEAVEVVQQVLRDPAS